MLLPPEFKRLLSALSLKKVEYLVVGCSAGMHRPSLAQGGEDLA